MKKLFALVPAIAVLTACNTAPIAQPTPSQVQAIQANSQVFKCDNNTQVVSLATERDGNYYANITVTSPMLGLNQAALVLKRDIAASGVRYTVTTNDKNTSYDWHIKGNEGVLTVMSNGATYNFSCSAN